MLHICSVRKQVVTAGLSPKRNEFLVINEHIRCAGCVRAVFQVVVSLVRRQLWSRHGYRNRLPAREKGGSSLQPGRGRSQIRSAEGKWAVSRAALSPWSACRAHCVAPVTAQAPQRLPFLLFAEH